MYRSLLENVVDKFVLISPADRDQPEAPEEAMDDRDGWEEIQVTPSRQPGLMMMLIYIYIYVSLHMIIMYDAYMYVILT